MEREYAIVSAFGRYMTAPNETGSGSFITLYTKDEAKLHIAMYYQGTATMKKMKV